MKILILVLTVCLVQTLAHSQEIRILTEELAPFSYKDPSDGRVKGVATDVVRAVLETLDMEIPIEIQPWARAYRIARDKPGILLFSLVRSDAREHLFHWVGRIMTVEIFFFRQAGRADLQIQSLEDAKQYRIATLNQDVTEQFLMARGFLKGTHLHSVPEGQLAVSMLAHGRVDLVLSSDLAFAQRISALNLNPAGFSKAFHLKALSQGLYIALSWKTPLQTVERFRQAYLTIDRSGLRDRIVAACLKNSLP